MSMQCQQIIELLVDYLDGQLDDEQTEKLESHLAQCPPCIDFVQSYRRTTAICKEALSIDMPAPVESTLFEFLRTELQSTKP